MKEKPTNGGMKADVRDRILSTAGDLFYREGTRAIGVDLIVARSGVAKTSLYRHFASKDELIEAFLRREDEDFWRRWDETAARCSTSEQELDAQLQWIGDRIARPDYRGCPQINIAAEYSDRNHPARKVAVAHKAELRRRLAAIALAMGLAHPDLFGLQMSIIVDGALSSGTALYVEGPAAFLQSIARTLLAAENAACTES